MPSQLRPPLAAAAVGAAAGLVLLGLGSRLSMRLIAAWTEALTPITLNGAVVGETTLGGTLRLAFQGAVTGAILGVAYLLVRRWLPSPRAAWFALLMLLVPGGVFLGDDEFELFEPSLLTAALFLPIFPLFGLAVAFGTDRLAPGPSVSRPPLALLAVCALGVVVFGANAVRLAT